MADAIRLNMLFPAADIEVIEKAALVAEIGEVGEAELEKNIADLSLAAKQHLVRNFIVELVSNAAADYRKHLPEFQRMVSARELHERNLREDATAETEMEEQ